MNVESMHRLAQRAHIETIPEGTKAADRKEMGSVVPRS